MQNKLRQLIISALKRNPYTNELALNIQVRGYYVTVRGVVSSDKLAEEVIRTIESVSPHLRVQSGLRVLEAVPALAH